mmetsp:Transcript_58319/g.126058  ORF Transcript_58319/g.126058 Transcript_58319/m.126058 type:complete len:184 (+) Transcript_58319:60-611(+)|eukprot:CAMPEP_0170602250 /NCGR_PEP_ID=MMETSP0224-20130122/18291_1 /TAXON_ID=285029 /ORGANISM="Togula jolla, Strain CCCM 725" /LENGTH=183 /DNA_ID=CAMNT_0010927077 /DNA_START=55 /DNA_END=606 /DNA_ORIENTATION=-
MVVSHGSRLAASLAVFACYVGALSPCDNEAGQVCPSSEGLAIGECLDDPSKHTLTDIDGNPRELEAGEEPMKISAECRDFIRINKACATEIDEHCSGMFFHGDTMTCLTTWTKPEVIGEACRAALPKVEAEDETVDAEKEAWRAKRKAARTQAQKDLKKEQENQEKAAKKKKKRKAKKNTDDL